jgi:hypothetical protein
MASASSTSSRRRHHLKTLLSLGRAEFIPFSVDEARELVDIISKAPLNRLSNVKKEQIDTVLQELYAIASPSKGVSEHLKSVPKTVIKMLGGRGRLNQLNRYFDTKLSLSDQINQVKQKYGLTVKDLVLVNLARLLTFGWSLSLNVRLVYESNVHYMVQSPRLSLTRYDTIETRERELGGRANVAIQLLIGEHQRQEEGTLRWVSIF